MRNSATELIAPENDSTSPDDIRRVIVDARDLTFSYGSTVAIDRVNFQIRESDLAVILGPNGSGKSTLLKLMLGLLKPQSGSMRLFGVDAHRFRDWAKIAYVPQVVEELGGGFPATVEELVAHGDYSGPNPLAVFRRRPPPSVDAALATAGISAIRYRRVSDLSVGQQQRVLIARAIVRSPELLVLDEPVAGVDAGGQEEFYALLHGLVADGMAVTLVSHDIGVAMREATVVACINKTLVFHGPPHAITGKELHDLYGLPIDILMHDDVHEHR
jgi:zinc transport system ATP-binding protein